MYITPSSTVGTTIVGNTGMTYENDRDVIRYKICLSENIIINVCLSIVSKRFAHCKCYVIKQNLL